VEESKGRTKAGAKGSASTPVLRHLPRPYTVMAMSRPMMTAPLRNVRVTQS
jgi:hypothetical protein